MNSETTVAAETQVLDHGPFYHGTKADLQVGDLLTAGFRSNYRPEVVMNHIYFTAVANGAGLAAALAAALAAGDGSERVYIVEPTGSFENDPNVTDKKFPGNPTRSYRWRNSTRTRRPKSSIKPRWHAPAGSRAQLGPPALTRHHHSAASHCQKAEILAKTPYPPS